MMTDFTLKAIACECVRTGGAVTWKKHKYYVSVWHGTWYLRIDYNVKNLFDFPCCAMIYRDGTIIRVKYWYGNNPPNDNDLP